ncbi:MAG: GTPase Era [Alphaproteobacteria bacterium]|nr:GTPase Era [Alphaproteobacteria bacterium]MBE8221052.1 GTPase Era [Alphaproteobacteria bacterium]
MTKTYCGFAAVIGPPNAGKTTLMNALVGQKMGIVSAKVQTTRTRLRGIAMAEATQIILVDTPGIFEPQKRLDRAMVHEAWSAVKEADEIMLVLDVAHDIKGGEITPQLDIVLQGLADVKKPVSLVLNKIDLVARKSLPALIAMLNAHYSFSHSFLIAANADDGVADIKSHLQSSMPEGVWLYPEDMAADIPSRLLAAEITREKLFVHLHQELPYALSVETETWETHKKHDLRIEQTIYVRREGQRAIILGAQGRTIKHIGASSRKELEQIFDCRVHLFLFVKVRKNWQDDPARYRALGLTYQV